MQTPHPANGDRADAAGGVPRARWSIRLLGIVVFAGCATVLGLAAWLRPDPRGFGTHEQLGGAPCGMLVATGFPCPSCGMTTAFAETMHGRPWRAIVAQPTGFVFALATIIFAFAALWTIATGRMPPLDYVAITPYRLFATLLVLLLAGWGVKILQVLLGRSAG